MDLNEIKKIIGEEGGKIIVVENNEPVLVIVSYNDYQNKKQKPEKKTENILPKEVEEEELKIEDLPF
ncbi:MAG: type II toxin-antitoxin system prevent-host-death family antitoxin [Candidatus Nealsonbacteria bacterium]|nr:type II toxin-antitoxin system prevent-host-death family antitoxin [Candidatus Nealsonbacteria bacterium]